MHFIEFKQDYIKNIQTVVESINLFFASAWKTKSFPSKDVMNDVPSFLQKTIEMFNYVEPTWVNNIKQVENAIDFVKSCADNKTTDSNEYNHVLLGLKSLRLLKFINENYEDFSKLVEGIGNLSISVIPDDYKSAIETFSTEIEMDIFDGIFAEKCYVFDEPYFDLENYMYELFDNRYITLNPNLNADTEVNRALSYTRWVDPNPNDDDGYLNDSFKDDNSDETIQEAAEINFFSDKPKNVNFKYDEKQNKFKISNQYKRDVDFIISGLKKCNTTDSLIKFFANGDNHDKMQLAIDAITDGVNPFIIAKVINNTTKYPFDDFDIDTCSKYIKSYKSIAEKNNGAKRFLNYDLFTVFKVDKEGTIKFLEDFMKLDLFNNADAVIANNTLLTLFNIFDSRIYLDILYNNLPDSEKKDDFATEDGFVKTVRARINANSRKANVYKEKDSSDKLKDANSTDAVVEYVNTALKELGDMSLTDMAYCEQFTDILYKEASIIDDKIFNNALSPIQINEYMSSCKPGLVSVFQEEETGDIPDYMKNRIKLDDSSDDVKILNYDLPDDAPLNPLNDVLGSIDAKMDMDGNVDDLLGSGYTEKHAGDKKKEAGIVYNITNNYSNSFNKTNTTTTNDLSSNKTTKNSDSSTGKKINNVNRHYHNTKEDYDNNYNNSIRSNNDTKVSSNVSAMDGKQILSSGHTIQEVFTFLEAEEPLSKKPNAGNKPKSDVLTTAMDVDRKTLGAQQTAKKGVQKVVNTGKAITKPFVRTKQWMTKIIDSLIKRDEDKVKAEIIENPSYRTALYKAGRLALKLGLTSISFYINGYLGAVYLAIQGAKAVDKQRLRKEVQSEFGAELDILDKKIELAEREDTKESRQAMYQMMRLRNKMQDIIVTSPKQKIKTPSSIW